MTSRKSSRGRYSIQASLCAKVDLQYFERQSLYFAEMGMSPDLFPLMLAHQLKGVYRLSSAEITKTLLSGFDKPYLESRAAFYSDFKGSYHMDEEQFRLRTMRVASRCGGFDRQHTEFIRCYKEVLRDPFLN